MLLFAAGAVLPASFFQPVQLAAVALGRSAVGIGGSDAAEPVELFSLFPQCCRFCVFFIQKPRLGCRTALVVQTFNLDFIGKGIERQVDNVAGGYGLAVFDLRAVYLNPAQFDVLLRQSAGFEKARRPKPFVQPHGGNIVIVFHTVSFEKLNLFEFVLSLA